MPSARLTSPAPSNAPPLAPPVFDGGVLDQLLLAPAQLLPSGPTALPPPTRALRGADDLVPLPTTVGAHPRDTALSLVLGHGYGLTRVELTGTASRAEHRSVASARGLFPTQVYCLLPGTTKSPGRLPPGLHQYDAVHHSLLPLRGGEVLPALAEVVGQDLSAASAVLVLTSRLALTAHRYGVYAYRLALQEAGMVAENLRLAADLVGLRHATYLALDGMGASALLGSLRDTESPVCVLALHPAGGRNGPVRWVPEPVPDPQAVRQSVPAAASSGQSRSPDAQVLGPLLRRLDQDGRRAAARQPRPPVPAVSRPVLGGDRRRLVLALARRHSGHAVFNSVPAPLATGALDGLLEAVGVGELLGRPAGDPPSVRCHLVVHAVTGVRSGHHVVEGDRLRARGTGDLTAALQEIQSAPGALSVNYHSAHLTVFLTGRLPVGPQDGRNGAWAFRRLSLQTGAMAQRISVWAASAGLAARVHNGYQAAAVCCLLDLPDGEVPLFQLLVGRPRPDGRYAAWLHHLPPTGCVANDP